jgi:hypothetical protein
MEPKPYELFITSILELYHHGIEDHHETNQDMCIIYILELYHHGIKDRHETNQDMGIVYTLELYHHGRSKITMRPTKRSCAYGSRAYF